MAVAELSTLGYFLPIFAFLLVFIVIYAILKKTGVLGDSDGIILFISFILASFFVVESSLVEFVSFSSSWFAVLVIGVFFIMMLVAFMPGDKPLEMLSKGSWFAWVLIGLMVAIFIVSSSYVFNWAINWDYVWDSNWIGLVLLIIIAAVVSFVIKGKSG